MSDSLQTNDLILNQNLWVKTAMSRWRRPANLAKVMQRVLPNSVPSKTPVGFAKVNISNSLHGREADAERIRQLASMLDRPRTVENMLTGMASHQSKPEQAKMLTRLRGNTPVSEFLKVSRAQASEQARDNYFSIRKGVNLPSRYADDLVDPPALPQDGTLYRGTGSYGESAAKSKIPFLHGTNNFTTATEYAKPFIKPDGKEVRLIDTYQSTPRQKYYEDFTLDQFLPRVGYRSELGEVPLNQRSSFVKERRQKSNSTLAYETPIRQGRNKFVGAGLVHPRDKAEGMKMISPGSNLERYFKTVSQPVSNYGQAVDLTPRHSEAWSRLQNPATPTLQPLPRPSPQLKTNSQHVQQSIPQPATQPAPLQTSPTWLNKMKSLIFS